MGATTFWEVRPVYSLQLQTNKVHFFLTYLKMIPPLTTEFSLAKSLSSCRSFIHVPIFLLQVISLWWINWHIYLYLLLVLLREIGHVWIHANLVFLRIHGLRMLRFLPHARDYWFPRIIALCSSHLSIYQV